MTILKSRGIYTGLEEGKAEGVGQSGTRKESVMKPDKKGVSKQPLKRARLAAELVKNLALFRVYWTGSCSW